MVPLPVGEGRPLPASTTLPTTDQPRRLGSPARGRYDFIGKSRARSGVRQSGGSRLPPPLEEDRTSPIETLFPHGPYPPVQRSTEDVPGCWRSIRPWPLFGMLRLLLLATLTAAGGGHLSPLGVHVVAEPEAKAGASTSAAVPFEPDRDQAFAPGPLALAVPAPSRGASLGPRPRSSGHGTGSAEGGDDWTVALSVSEAHRSDAHAPSFRARWGDPSTSPRPPPAPSGTS